MAASS